MSKENFRAYLALFAAIFFWASAFVAIRIGLVTWTPGGLGLLRYVFAAICLLAVAPFISARRPWHLSRRELATLAVLALLGIVGYQLGLNYGEQTLDAATASFIVSQMPIFAMVLSVMFLKETLTLRGGCGLALGIFGTIMILYGTPGRRPEFFGVICVVLAVASQATYFVMQKNAMSRFSPFEVNFLPTLFAVIFLAPFAQHAVKAGACITCSAVASVVYLGVFPAALAYFLWSYAIQRLGVVTAATTFYALPAITTLMNMTLLGVNMSATSLIGGAIALSGAILCKTGGNCAKRVAKTA